MPVGQIDNLLKVIAVMNAMTGVNGPFTTHKDLYSTIDATNLGVTPWSHFNLYYQGEKSANPPLWRTEDFTMWFLNPLTMIHNLLSNPDFDGSFDYLPFQECHEHNNHWYKNFISRNWSWKQVVHLIY